ncbi:MAG: REP-associated tyrosine transposase [Isosphaeraceae bacterium]
MIPGETSCFTVVTSGRRSVFGSERAVRDLGDSLRLVRNNAPLRTIAMVVLLDHLHGVWRLPRRTADFSTRWKRITRKSTIRWRVKVDRPMDPDVPAARRARGAGGIWQRRFREPVVRDEHELKGICEYIHSL